MPDLPKFLLPKQAKWSVGNNRFDEDGKAPKALSVFIPEESIDAFCRYVQDQRAKLKPGKSWNYSTQQNDEVQGIYLNFKGRDGDSGAYGNINPAAPKGTAPSAAPAPDNDLPF